jgi:hypothetical protein
MQVAAMTGVMLNRQSWLFPAALALVLCGPLPAQETNSPEATTGWRRFDEATPASPASPAGQLTLPAGTWITVRIDQELSSDHNLPGDGFTASLVQPLVANGFVVARRGQTVGGRVDEAQKAGRSKGTSRLGIALTELSLVDGRQVPVTTRLTQYRGGSSVGRDVGAVATTTGAGAAIGAAAQGGFGAGMGAIAGAAAGMIGVLSTRGKATVIYPETSLTFRLEEPLTISTESSARAFRPVVPEDYAQEPTLHRERRAAVAPPPPYYYYGGWDSWYSPYYYPRFFYGPSFYYFSGPRFHGGHRGFRRW